MCQIPRGNKCACHVFCEHLGYVCHLLGGCQTVPDLGRGSVIEMFNGYSREEVNESVECMPSNLGKEAHKNLMSRLLEIDFTRVCIGRKYHFFTARRME